MSKITLNVGAGERTFKEYPPGHKCINYDERNIPGHTDEVGDVRKLPYDDETFDYILASDIIEHFPISETNKILTEWKRVLKVGGVIEFRLPNLETICKKYVKGEHDAKMTSWLLFGGQTYRGNYHYVGFDKKWFISILKENGLEPYDFKESGNNFEIKGRKK